jgi:hypothetical protein
MEQLMKKASAKKAQKTIDGLYDNAFHAMGSGIEFPIMALGQMRNYAVSLFLSGETMENAVFQAISKYQVKKEGDK